MLKFTEKEIVNLVENDKVIERFNENTFKGQTSCDGIVEIDDKFYQIQFAQGVDEWAEVIAWDQNAPEVKKVNQDVSVEVWIPVEK